MRTPFIALSLAALCLAADAAPASTPPFIGLWEGVYHGGHGDQPVALVLHPRGPLAFVGMVYFDGGEFGPIEDGRVNGDSLTFRATNYPFLGELRGNQLTMTLVVPHGSRHEFTLTHTGTDTTQLPASFHAAAAASAAPKLERDTAPDSVFAAHAVSPEEAPGVSPCLQHGTLLLVGGGAGQSDIERRFVELAGDAAARIVVIPTAHVETVDQDAIEQFGVAAARIFGVPKVTVLHTCSRREADSEAFAGVLKNATGVWIDGGEASYLLNAYMGTRTERELIALLDRGGVIGGTSAGALIWGSRSVVYRAHPGAKSYQLPTADDMLLGDRREPDLGVLRNVLVSPHFTEFKQQAVIAKMLALYPRLLAIGIDEATAVEVHGDTGTVLGRGKVTILRGQAAPPLFVLKAGARFDLRRQTLW
jgi:cyanophycinase